MPREATPPLSENPVSATGLRGFFMGKFKGFSAEGFPKSRGWTLHIIMCFLYTIRLFSSLYLLFL